MRSGAGSALDLDAMQQQRTLKKEPGRLTNRSRRLSLPVFRSRVCTCVCVCARACVRAYLHTVTSLDAGTNSALHYTPYHCKALLCLDASFGNAVRLSCPLLPTPLLCGTMGSTKRLIYSHILRGSTGLFRLLTHKIHKGSYNNVCPTSGTSMQLCHHSQARTARPKPNPRI